MIRLLRVTILQIISLLRLLQEGEDRDRRTNEEVTHFRALVRDVMMSASDADAGDVQNAPRTLDELIKLLEDNIAALDSGQALGLDLIDSMVQVLNTPYASNALAGKTLTALRKAILLPSEVKAFQLELEKQERHCSACGALLFPTEMVMYSNGTVICSACTRPNYIRCTSHKHVVPVSDTFTRVVRKLQECDQCKQEQESDRVSGESLATNEAWNDHVAGIIEDEERPAAPTRVTPAAPSRTRPRVPSVTNVLQQTSDQASEPLTLQQIEDLRNRFGNPRGGHNR